MVTKKFLVTTYCSSWSESSPADLRRLVLRSVTPRIDATFVVRHFAVGVSHLASAAILLVDHQLKLESEVFPAITAHLGIGIAAKCADETSPQGRLSVATNRLAEEKTDKGPNRGTLQVIATAAGLRIHGIELGQVVTCRVRQHSLEQRRECRLPMARLSIDSLDGRTTHGADIHGHAPDMCSRRILRRWNIRDLREIVSRPGTVPRDCGTAGEKHHYRKQALHDDDRKQTSCIHDMVSFDRKK